MKENKKYNIWSFVFGFVITVFLFSLIFLAAMLCSCTSQPSKAAERYSGREAAINEKVDWQERVIITYGDLLHEIWIDRPTYVEECLSEGDTFQKLSDLFGSDFGDIFTFWSVEDSVRYHHNWDNNGLPVMKIKRITLPDEKD